MANGTCNFNLTAFGIGFLAGAIIGGAAALLYAPRPGKETREILKSKTMEAGEMVRERVGDVREKVGDVREKVSEIREKIRPHTQTSE